jgi:hypothetical protein
MNERESQEQVHQAAPGTSVPAAFTDSTPVVAWRYRLRGADGWILSQQPPLGSSVYDVQPLCVAGEPNTKTDAHLLRRAAEALAAYMGAMRVDTTDDRASIMAAIKKADALAKPVYAELYEALIAPTEQDAPAVTARVDWLGLALDLEAQAKRVESQTTERVMLAAARGLRLMGNES